MLLKNLADVTLPVRNAAHNFTLLDLSGKDFWIGCLYHYPERRSETVFGVSNWKSN